jgi:uncharacterized protein (TIGR00251 family)
LAVNVELQIRVIPRAGRNAFAGMREGALVVRLAAAPVDGAANEALIDLFSKTLSLPKRNITIVSGERSRLKRVRIDGLDREQVLAQLGVHLD